MAIGDIFIVVFGIISALTTLTITFLLYKLVKTITRYVAAENLIQDVTNTPSPHQDQETEGVEKINPSAEKIQAVVRRLAIKVKDLENRLNELTRKTQPSTRQDTNLVTVREEVQILSRTQERLRKQIATFNEVIRKNPSGRRDNANMQGQRPSSIQMTETENRILQFLLVEGPMTAPDIEKQIGKTREHTSRLMKKLWREGYVERDTHTMPFIYKPTKGLKRILDEKMKSASKNDRR